MIKTESYEICPGAMMEIYDVYSDEVYMFERPAPEDEWSLRLDYCMSGRLEAEFTGNKFAYIDAGQMTVNSNRYDMCSSHFPLKAYKGLSILIFEDRLPERCLRMWQTLGLDLREIKEKIDRNAVWLIERLSEKTEAVFGELYFGAGIEEREFLWIKLTELLYRVKRMVNGADREYFYFAGDVSARVKRAVKDALSEREYSIERMIERSGLGTSAFYDRFGKIYGTTPAKYLRDFRLGEAAMKLSSTEISIQRIAEEAGYVNFSKFSAAFRKLYAMSPSEYRRRYRNVEPSEKWIDDGKKE